MDNTQNDNQQNPPVAVVEPNSPTVAAEPDAASRQPGGFKLDRLLEWTFRLGLAAVFIINSIMAIVRPDSFLELIEHNFVSQFISHSQLLLYVIAVNDLLVGLLILSGIKKKYVYAWAGVWLAIVSFFKLAALI